MPEGRCYPRGMAAYLLLTDVPVARALPALRVAGLDHKVEPRSLAPARVAQIAPLAVLVDAASDPSAGFAALLDLRAAPTNMPLVAVVAKGGLERHPWYEVADDILLRDCSEEELRVRLTMLRRRSGGVGEDEIRLGPLVIDAAAYRATVDGRPLDLTYKEFELIRFLASHRGRVFTREDLLLRVWGYGFYGGTRTVDVHVRRLRSKLGPIDEHLIETVRGVGYRAAEFLL